MEYLFLLVILLIRICLKNTHMFKKQLKFKKGGMHNNATQISILCVFAAGNRLNYHQAYYFSGHRLHSSKQQLMLYVIYKMYIVYKIFCIYNNKYYNYNLS